MGFSVVKFMDGTHFDAESANAWNLGSVACEFKKANIGTATANQVFFQNPFNSAERIFVNVLACDTIFDGRERYDTAFFDFDKNLSNSFIARMHEGDWAPFELPLIAPPDSAFPDLGKGKIGSWVKLLKFDPDLGAFNIYLGISLTTSVSRNPSWTKSTTSSASGRLNRTFSTSNRDR